MGMKSFSLLGDKVYQTCGNWGVDVDIDDKYWCQWWESIMNVCISGDKGHQCL